jgi:signal transduction histidine kinase/CheY-like chemotaxis protein
MQLNASRDIQPPCSFGLFLFFSFVIESEYDLIERTHVREHRTRLEVAIVAAAERVRMANQDWSKWNETYEFMESRSEEYFASVVTYDYVKSLRVHHILFLDQSGKLVRGFSLSEETEEMADLTEEVRNAIEGNQSWAFPTNALPRVGYLQIGEGLYAAASVTIQDSKISKDARGSLVFLERVDEGFVEALAKTTQLPVKLASPSHDLGRLRPARRALPNGAVPPTSVVEVYGADSIGGATTVFDGAGNPVFTLSMQQPRTLHRQGLDTRNSILLCLAVGGLLSALVTLYLIQTGVIRRLRRLSNELRATAATCDSSSRVATLGNDEVTTIATDVNAVLAALQASENNLRVARDAAESANQAKSAFVAKVSHELRTPIHSITGMLRILFREERSAAKRDYIKMARDAAYSLLGTINDILDFSKMESGSLTLESIPFSLREMLRDSIRTVGPRADEKKDLELVAYVDPALPDRLLGDPLRLKQSMINLLGNAVKFTPQGAVTLEAKLDSIKDGVAHVRFMVRDTGVGIPAHRLDKIFDPFTQADESVARVFTGSGLGLTITKQLSESMGGNVSVTSALGLGTEFVISVPLPLDPAAEEWALPPLPGDSGRVVVIDEQSAASEEWTKYLKAVGYAVDWVNCGDDRAVQRATELAERASMVVVTEVALTRSAIFNMIVTRATHPLPIPLVAVLSSSAIALREKLLTLSIGAILVRPCLPEDLILVATGNLDMETGQWAADVVLEAESNVQLRVLLADDTYTNRFILQSMLEEGGHQVTAVTNGQELLDAVALTLSDPTANPPFDAVFTDVQMPLMDGMTATRKVRELEATLGNGVHTPIFAVTAHAMNEEKSRMREAGVDDVVTKPVEPSDVSRVLGIACEGKDFSNRTPVKTTKVIIDEELTLPELAERVWEEHLRAGSDPATYVPSPASASAPSPKRLSEVVNIADTFERSGRSTRRTLMIFKAFLGSYRDVLSDLSTAKTEQDPEHVRKASHSLKGILLEVGAIQAGGVAAKIENLSSQGEIQEATKLINGILHQTVATAGLIERIVQAAEKGPQQAAPPSPGSPEVQSGV